MFTDRLLKADSHEVKIIEDFSDLDAKTVSDDIVENAQDTMTFKHINYIQDKIYYITYAILLIGILSTGFKKMAIFDKPLIRNFTVTALFLALFGNSMRWLNDYGMYSEFLSHSLGVILTMTLSSFIIIILGLGSGIGRY